MHHRKRWHYLNLRGRTSSEAYREAVEDAEARRDERLNGHATVNGHDASKPKLTLADLGLGAQPTTQSFKRRKLNTQNAKQEERAT